MSGREVAIRWNGARARAWLPDELARRDLEVSVRVARHTEQAAAAAVRAGASRRANFEPIARLLLRAEGVASSSIEGLRTPLVDVAAAEVGGFEHDVASWVADNLAAVVDALADAARPLTVEVLHSWHRRLMAHGDRLAPEMIGAFRVAQSWIGGTSPVDAAFVPPPSEHVPALVDDLVAFVNGDELDAVTQAAVAHAQFETIHPYGDGNGRIGRILVGWVLARRLAVAVTPPVSVFVARDPGGYLAGLRMFRLGELDPWVDWLATTVQRSSDAAADLMDRAELLGEMWEARVGDLRADATARQVLEMLLEHPVLSSDLVAERAGVSERAGRAALATLAERGIVQPYTRSPGQPGRPRRWWVAGELIEIIARWSGN